MTHPVAVQGLHVDEPAVDEITAPLLAAIQHSFEEAMASLDDLARSSGPVATAGTGASGHGEDRPAPGRAAGRTGGADGTHRGNEPGGAGGGRAARQRRSAAVHGAEWTGGRAPHGFGPSADRGTSPWIARQRRALDRVGGPRSRAGSQDQPPPHRPRDRPPRSLLRLTGRARIPVDSVVAAAVAPSVAAAVSAVAGHRAGLGGVAGRRRGRGAARVRLLRAGSPASTAGAGTGATA